MLFTLKKLRKNIIILFAIAFPVTQIRMGTGMYDLILALTSRGERSFLRFEEEKA